VSRDTATRAVGAFLGLSYIALGTAELLVRIGDGDLSLLFWFPTLVGGGVLVLAGVFKITSPAWASLTLVTVGALLGALAAAWTILAPILAITLIALTIQRTRQVTASTA